MTLKNCTPADWINDSPTLPTIATLRLEWQRAEAEHAALLAERGMELETAGEPDEWACPPPCEACGGTRYILGVRCGHCDNE